MKKASGPYSRSSISTTARDPMFDGMQLHPYTDSVVCLGCDCVIV
jgi:hypothetical protein